MKITSQQLERSVLSKVSAEKALSVAKEQEKEKLNIGYNFVKVNSRTLVLKK